MNTKDYNLFYVFTKVCELKSYSKVAEVMEYGSYQIISEKMQTLASRLGINKLFVRHSRGVEPTSEALALYDRVKKSLGEIDNAEDSIKVFDENSDALIRIAIPSTTLSIEFLDYFVKFTEKYPKVRLECISKDSLDLLRQNKIDLAIDYEHTFEGQNFNVIRLLKDEFIFIASKSFLAKHGLSANMSLRDIEKTALITCHFLNELISKTKIPFRPFITTPTFESLFALVKKEIGIGFFSATAFNQIADKGDVIKLNIPNVFSSNFSCAHNHKRLSKPATAFVEGLLEYIRTNSL